MFGDWCERTGQVSKIPLYFHTGLSNSTGKKPNPLSLLSTHPSLYLICPILTIPALTEECSKLMFLYPLEAGLSSPFPRTLYESPEVRPQPPLIFLLQPPSLDSVTTTVMIPYLTTDYFFLLLSHLQAWEGPLIYFLSILQSAYSQGQPLEMLTCG